MSQLRSVVLMYCVASYCFVGCNSRQPKPGVVMWRSEIKGVGPGHNFYFGPMAHHLDTALISFQVDPARKNALSFEQEFTKSIEEMRRDYAEHFSNNRIVWNLDEFRHYKQTGNRKDNPEQITRVVISVSEKGGNQDGRLLISSITIPIIQAFDLSVPAHDVANRASTCRVVQSYDSSAKKYVVTISDEETKEAETSGHPES